jgi:hypothetical protein
MADGWTNCELIHDIFLSVLVFLKEGSRLMDHYAVCVPDISNSEQFNRFPWKFILK